jgi:regulator of protease activity HflC (stomatin/prohibitin superfamily)
MFIGEQAATEYLASSDMMAVMSTARNKAEEAMKKRVQSLADARNLGIEVVSLTILGAHPPAGEVAPAYQNVIGAMEEKETKILEAQAYAAKTLPQSEAQARQFIADARAYDYKVRTVAAAESERFTTLLRTYRIMPSMFILRSYLEFLEQDCKNMRKFVVSSGLGNEVFQFNFEEKERLDLIDTDITQLTNKK